jgi:hypothetical protein
LDPLYTRELADRRAVELFHDSPDGAFSGSIPYSAETNSKADQSLAIVSLACQDQDRFIELVGFLSPAIQDIFFQYYLLGRTYEQIGTLLFPQKTRAAAQAIVKRGNYFGLRALCAVIRFGGHPNEKQTKRYPLLAAAYDAMLTFQARIEVAGASAKTPTDLGDFEIAPNGHLAQFFAPSWSVLGPSSSLGFNQCHAGQLGQD